MWHHNNKECNISTQRLPKPLPSGAEWSCDPQSRFGDASISAHQDSRCTLVGGRARRLLGPFDLDRLGPQLSAQHTHLKRKRASRESRAEHRRAGRVVVMWEFKSMILYLNSRRQGKRDIKMIGRWQERLQTFYVSCHANVMWECKGCRVVARPRPSMTRHRTRGL